MKKLVIAAGTGFLCQVLINHLKNNFDEIIILTRGTSNRDDQVHYANWDAKTMTGWEKYLENADVLINLAGKSVDCRYNDENKRKFSRHVSTAQKS